jgi:hypothetical protein
MCPLAGAEVIGKLTKKHCFFAEFWRGSYAAFQSSAA